MRRRPSNNRVTFEATVQQYRRDIAFLESLNNTTSTPYGSYKKIGKNRALLRVRRLLTLLGNPENKLAFIHIAGTSGKGSTVKLLERLIENSGKTCGAFTGPFATTSIERVSVNGVFISPRELHDILEKKTKPALDSYVKHYGKNTPSYFEVFFALALLYFRERHCDYAVLEAGLGGTYDATNVIPAPVVSAITSVGIDHTRLLGTTKKLIAREKAGIIKKGSQFLTAEKNPRITSLFKKICTQEGALFVPLTDKINRLSGGSYFSTPAQKSNLNLALNIMERLPFPVRDVKKVITSFHLIARQEIMQRDPLVIIDGAHNIDKLKNVAEFVRKQRYQKLHLVVAMAASKNYSSALKPLCALADSITVTRFLSPARACAPLSTLAAICTRQSKHPGKTPVTLFVDPHQALETVLDSAGKKDVIVVTGSFFLAGALRAHWIPEEKILKQLSA